ncbi:LysE family translocator [Comamonas piscis]|uniref:LysE family translocator n=1 Tax=Comamonas piscis TaxID=1562974 RepID=A0A7G5EM95_9BURK|nr:LysE family translocator [Comamonas piscis]QMV75120.1 LysE family translocator [Comamonas piscis]WSO33605.1 LysE family translocator [Comamonas piscis]
MPTFQSLLAFFGVAVLLALSPGPDNLFVLMQSIQRGWRVGIAVVVGLCLGVVVHTTAVALGLAAVFAASSIAFTVLKWCGAAYLAYLAWGAWRAPVAADASAGGAAAGGSGRADIAGKDLLVMVRRGVVMNLTNPKVLIFFLAFLPQFADPNIGPVGPQIFVFGAVFILAAFLVFGAIALFSGAFGNLLLRSPRAQFWLNKITAVVFVGLAVKLATAQR